MTRSAQCRAWRIRVGTIAAVALVLASLRALLPDPEARASWQYVAVLGLGYGHLIGALGSRTSRAAPSAVCRNAADPGARKAGDWKAGRRDAAGWLRRAFVASGLLVLLALYGWALERQPVVTLLLLFAIATWHSVENDLRLRQACEAHETPGARAGLGPLPLSLDHVLASVGLTAAVLVAGSGSLTAGELGPAFADAPLAQLGAQAARGVALLTGLGLAALRGLSPGRRALGASLAIAAPTLPDDLRGWISFADFFAATTLYHLISWLLLLRDRARQARGAGLARRLLWVHGPAAALCGLLAASDAPELDPLRALVLSPGLYLFWSVLHVLQTAILRGAGGPAMRRSSVADPAAP